MNIITMASLENAQRAFLKHHIPLKVFLTPMIRLAQVCLW
jgi:hypothetical protein